ncbi:hypothetical protein M407DRAFT_120533 [Tulasnella calospora MUT 4182]|uniref:Uncharacterized protein n=1 Tax=Tulasnella calospora MUT 4182 TaxID=1051891 RepID=A0A0C3Q1K6_9AGAM|nr:hypothetical protein M407DRAFT_120533 [Tulasnella calospora MUT 4182]
MSVMRCKCGKDCLAKVGQPFKCDSAEFEISLLRAGPRRWAPKNQLLLLSLRSTLIRPTASTNWRCGESRLAATSRQSGCPRTRRSCCSSCQASQREHAMQQIFADSTCETCCQGLLRKFEQISHFPPSAIACYRASVAQIIL